VEHRDHPKRLFLRGVRNHVFPNELEPKRARRDIGAAIALTGEANQGANAVEDLRYHLVSGVRVTVCDVFADLVDVVVRLRVHRIESRE